MNRAEVLVVGAGPTGLVLGLFLAKAGVRARIIDKNSGPGQASRAVMIQARTLEFYQQLDIARDVIARGIKVDAVNVHSRSERVAVINVGDIGHGISPYPFVLSFPQDDHERLLIDKLKATGIEVEWNTEIVALHDTGEEVSTAIRRPDATEQDCAFSYVCGCDGARSLVRRSLGLDFAGAAYDKTFFLADVEVTDNTFDSGDFNMCLAGDDFLMILPVRSTGTNRLIGMIPSELSGRENITFDDLRPYVERLASLNFRKVNWFSTYRVHHRVAEHFRVGRMFLSGDAGHIHSPVGGQGMNTGIGDAVNLSWKLAAVLQGRAETSILDSYEPERIAFARTLVATTDRMFKLITGSGMASHMLRGNFLPHLAPFAFRLSALRTKAFQFVSQTRIHYRGSALSEGSAGSLRGGDRLPWIEFSDGTDNFAPLSSFDWQCHVYGRASLSLKEVAAAAKIPILEFEWAESLENVGLTKDTLYLVRPDGYIGLADTLQDAIRLQTFLRKFKIVA